jgi:hypothetical protein
MLLRRWAFDNPNVLTYEIGGDIVELKVTKRAVETPDAAFISKLDI